MRLLADRLPDTRAVALFRAAFFVPLRPLARLLPLGSVTPPPPLGIITLLALLTSSLFHTTSRSLAHCARLAVLHACLLCSLLCSCFALSGVRVLFTVYLWHAYFLEHLQSHLRRALLIRLFGSLAVLSLVSRDFIPHIRAQKDLRRDADLGLDFALAALTGGLRVPPVCFL